MQGLIWTAVLWTLAMAFLRFPGLPPRMRDLSKGLGREHAVLILIMLTTHARADRLGVEDTLANPFVAETLTRAALSLAALLVLLPMFVPVARLARSMRLRRYGMLALGAYGAVALLSVTYSVAPLVTAGKVLELGITLGLAWVLLARADAADALKRTVTLLLYLEGALILVAVVGFFLVPGIFSADLSRRGFFFRGTMLSPFSGPNALSSVGATLAAFGFAQFLSVTPRRQARPWLWLVVLGTSSTMLASGRQGVAIWVVSFAALLFVYRRLLFMLFIAPVGGAVTALYLRQILEVLSRDQVQGSLDTLTGRTTFWAAGVRAWLAEPITGYGFGAGGRFVALKSIGADQFTHLHNGFLEALTGVGLLGFIPFMYAVFRLVLWAGRSLLRRVDAPYAILPIPLILQNLVGLGFGAWLNVNLMLFVLLVALADAQGMRSPPGRRRRREFAGIRRAPFGQRTGR
jgi:O-antigen ligase